MPPTNSDAKGKCFICLQDAVQAVPELFGPWMKQRDISVHYFCLLLSTNLPQRGIDQSGILGFLMQDIRNEACEAKKRSCEFCGKVGASISCDGCKIYFHLRCGLRNNCLFQYDGKFPSYCDKCLTLDDFEKEVKRNWEKQELQLCYICGESFGKDYSPVNYIHAKCCNEGFVHRVCMQQYAMSAGYYMRCIWCRETSFRDKVRLQGIFVPDREAQWESRRAYANLHNQSKRCDMDICHCPMGRQHDNRSWKIVTCSLCGSFGAHYPRCVITDSSTTSHKHDNNAGKVPLVPDFKCEICLAIQTQIIQSQELMASMRAPSQALTSDENCLDMTYYIQTDRKDTENAAELDASSSSTIEHECDNGRIYEIHEVYELSKDYQILGSAKLRIDRNSPRFVDKTMEEIYSTPGLILESDIIERTSDIGIFQQINDYIDEVVGVPTLEELLSIQFND